jgi:hypothetical protein
MVGKVATFMVCGWFFLASTKDWFLGVNPPRTTCATTCSVWNSLLNNKEYMGEVSSSVVVIPGFYVKTKYSSYA